MQQKLSGNSFDDKPFSPSYLLAGNGFRSSGLNYYAWGGFLTMRPYELYSDRYVSFLYKHDFDKFLWQAKISKPYLSLAHNMLYGSIKSENRIANPGITTPVSGYHESGIMINQLLQQNIAHAINIYLNAGEFYHWENQSTWKRNGVWLIGLGVGF